MERSKLNTKVLLILKSYYPEKMDYTELLSLEEITAAISENRAILVYFSAPQCMVCHTLKPKLAEMLQEDYPLIKKFYVDITKAPVISGQMRVFSIPTVLFFFEEREYLRKSRNFGIDELKGLLRKIYNGVFEEG